MVFNLTLANQNLLPFVGIILFEQPKPHLCRKKPSPCSKKFSSLTSTDTKFWKSQHLIRSHLIFFHLQYVTKHVIFSRLSLSFSRSFYENEKCQIKLTSAARLNKRSWVLISAFNLRIYKVSFIVENRVEQFVAVVNFIVDLAQLIILSKLNHLFPMSSVSVVGANVKHNRTAGLQLVLVLTTRNKQEWLSKYRSLFCFFFMTAFGDRSLLTTMLFLPWWSKDCAE